MTHNGAAHRDDFLACCVVLFHEFSQNMHRPAIERRMVLPSDLTSDHTYVIDTGGEWDPKLLNFDHHQEDPRLVDRCALDLVLEHLMAPDDRRYYVRTNDWLKLTSIQDTRGSSEAALSLGVTPRAYAIMRSPVELYVLRWFADAQVVHPDSALWALMLEIGRGVMASVPDVAAQRDALRGVPGPVMMHGISVWDIRDAWASDDRHGFAVVNDMAARRGVDVVISHNLRSGKVGLYRQEWSAHKLDLSRLAAHPKHHASHQNGFYAVVESDVKDFELLEMIEMAANKPA